MGCYAEDCAEKFQFSREKQNNFAKQSLLRARAAIEKGFLNMRLHPLI